MKCQKEALQGECKSKGRGQEAPPEVELCVGFCVLNFTLGLLSHWAGSNALSQQQMDPVDHCWSNYSTSF